MRAGLFVFAIIALVGCKPTAEPAERPWIEGAWLCKTSAGPVLLHVMQDHMLVFMGPNFNVNATYTLKENTLTLTGATMQYQAPGFKPFKTQDVEFKVAYVMVNDVSKQSISLIDVAGKLLPLGEEIRFKSITRQEASEVTGTITGKHRQAIIDAVKKPKKP